MLIIEQTMHHPHKNENTQNAGGRAVRREMGLSGGRALKKRKLGSAWVNTEAIIF